MKWLNRIHRLLYPKNKITLYNLNRMQSYDVEIRMFEAMFELLREYVEEDIVRMHIADNKRYSRWENIKHRWIPRRWNKEFCVRVAMEYLNAESSKVIERPVSADHSSQIKDLYIWYTLEYPKLKDPYEMYPDPQNLFLDESGWPTNKMFTENTDSGRTLLNKVHPDYERVIHQIFLERDRQMQLIDNKLEQLLKIRRTLWS